MLTTNAPAKARLRARAPLAGTVIVTLALATPAFALAAQTVVHPTPAERARQQVHAQQLRTRQHNNRLKRQIQQRTQATANKAFKNHPTLQQNMRQNNEQRHRQSRERDRDLDREVRQSQVPPPISSASQPAPAQS
jgi:hypothetical protein